MNCTALMHLRVKTFFIFPGLGRCISRCIFLQLWPRRLPGNAVWPAQKYKEQAVFHTSVLTSVRPRRQELAVLTWVLVFNQLNLFLPWHAQFHYKFSETVASLRALGLEDGKVSPLFNWGEKLVTAAGGVCLGSSTATPSGGHTAAHFSSNVGKAWAKPYPEHVLYAVCLGPLLLWVWSFFSKQQVCNPSLSEFARAWLAVQADCWYNQRKL